jgi:GDPmannose 4,6-dehydratase
MRALITGITGQDGSYLAELLLSKGYEVHGVVRQPKTLDQSRIAHLCKDPDLYGRRLLLHQGDLTDPESLCRALEIAHPGEVYHLAGQSHVGLSFEMPEVTAELIGMATVRLLELVRVQKPAPKFFHASSSEIFGQPDHTPQDENTPIEPVSPYGCAKAFATQMVKIYRRSFGLFACNGIFYNHESPRRGEGFVTQKICRAAAAIKLGLQKELLLGDTSAQRDWGHARDYVDGMWLTLQHHTPDDYVFATGQLHTVQDIVEHAFGYLQLDWRKHLRLDPTFSRPSDPRRMAGNPAKARQALGWKPQTCFEDLINEMTDTESKFQLGVVRQK